MLQSPDTILDRLTTLYPKAIEPGLTRTLRILDDLGNPHLNLPPVIHVAGTNGKGSTIAFIRAVAEASGLNVHVMTSPHLVRFNERLVIAGQEISDPDLFRLLQEVETINDGKPVTFFEITTAAGLLAFSRAKADLCLLETGMGGRLDSTNVVPNPIATVITNISFDHMQHLGTSLRDIAGEKAGIIKADTPCIIGPLTREAINGSVIDIFTDRAAQLNAPLFLHGRDWDYLETLKGFGLTFKGATYFLPRPNLSGRHQIANAATAAVTLLTAGLPLNNGAGLQSASWPGRLQKMTGGSFYDLLPDGWELWLDGGHNEDGGRILAEQALDWQQWDVKPLHLILGMLTTKNPEDFYRHLRAYAASATAVSIPDEKLAFKAEDLAQKIKISEAGNIAEAIKSIIAVNNSPQRILITGSLYLAGQVLRQNKKL